MFIDFFNIFWVWKNAKFLLSTMKKVPPKRKILYKLLALFQVSWIFAQFYANFDNIFQIIVVLEPAEAHGCFNSLTAQGGYKMYPRWKIDTSRLAYCKDRWEHCAYFNIVKKIVRNFLIIDKIHCRPKSLNKCGSTWIHVIKSYETREKLFSGKFQKVIENYV